MQRTRPGGEDTTATDAGAAKAEPRVEVRRSARRKRTVTAYREQDTIVVLIPQRMSKRDEQFFVDDMVAKVLAREARTRPPRGDVELAERARLLADRFLAPRLGHRPEPADVVWVTNQSQRWGSCTPATGVIRLSHRLQSMPAWVSDYVLLHELAHLVEPTHCAAFWRLVENYPEAQRAKGFLEGWQAARGVAADPQDDVLAADQA
ncbi:M48 family metallopeptidase [Microlunatus panaciterrae]|uniref:Metal-dependent hydrolase n=1 Tax=Microlunatus panaciterrae TaxID=400768 RepID=A0ABS2REQ4_9ACTN|nr:M48 family metallopeptidase [Microlunatus panaciterrae]MBM7797489.1 putative metal-dependent hydrolase [Microlunatus panaciterrae]